MVHVWCPQKPCASFVLPKICVSERPDERCDHKRSQTKSHQNNDGSSDRERKKRGIPKTPKRKHAIKCTTKLPNNNRRGVSISTKHTSHTTHQKPDTFSTVNVISVVNMMLDLFLLLLLCVSSTQLKTTPKKSINCVVWLWFKCNVQQRQHHVA